MKYSLFGTATCLVLLFSNCKPSGTTPSVSNTIGADSLATVADAKAAIAAGSKVVFVNIDSLQDRYTWFKQKNEGFMQRQKNLENSMAQKAEDFQKAVYALQQKAQAGTTPPAQLQQEEKALGERQQQLALERDQKAKGLMDESTKFNEELRKRIKNVLSDLQKQKGYDYVISYSDNVGSQFWYVNPSLDITKEALEALNATTPK